MQLTSLDWILLAFIGLSALLSLTRGFVREAISLVSWGAAFAVTGKFYEQLAAVFTFSNDEMTRIVLAVICLFLGTLVAAGLLSKLINSLLSKSGLSAVDRLLGVIFGLLRGILVLAALLAFMQILFRMHILSFVAEASWWKDSVLLPELSRIVNWFFQYMNSVPADSAAGAAAEAVSNAVSGAVSGVAAGAAGGS